MTAAKRPYELHYCYPSSPAAVKFGRTGYYIAQSWKIISQRAFDTVKECEEWAKSQNIPLAAHRFGE